MKKHLLFTLCISGVMLLSACGGQTAEPAVSQTVSGAENAGAANNDKKENVQRVDALAEESKTDTDNGDAAEEKAVTIDPSLEKSILEAPDNNYEMPDEEMDKIWEFVRRADGQYINEEKGFGIYEVRHPDVNYMIYLGDYKDHSRNGSGVWFNPEAGVGFVTTWVNDEPTGAFEMWEMYGGNAKTTGNLRNGLYDGVVKTVVTGADTTEIESIEEIKYDNGIAEIVYTESSERDGYGHWYGLKTNKEQIDSGEYREYDDAVSDDKYVQEHLNAMLDTVEEDYKVLPAGIPGYADCMFQPEIDYDYEMTEEEADADKEKKAEAAEVNDKTVSEMAEQLGKGNLAEAASDGFPFGTVRPVSMKYIPDGDPALYSVAFEYDDNGKLIFGHYVNTKRGRNGTYRYNYDGDRLISRDFKWDDGGEYGQTVTFTYGQSGYVEDGLEHEENAEEEMIWHAEIHYEYGDDGKLLKAVMDGYEDDGYEKLSTDGVYEFEY